MVDVDVAFCVMGCSDMERRIEEALRLIGCPYPLGASQIETLDFKAVFPVVQWLVNRVRAFQHDDRDHEVTNLL